MDWLKVGPAPRQAAAIPHSLAGRSPPCSPVHSFPLPLSQAANQLDSLLYVWGEAVLRLDVAFHVAVAATSDRFGASATCSQHNSSDITTSQVVFPSEVIGANAASLHPLPLSRRTEERPPSTANGSVAGARDADPATVLRGSQISQQPPKPPVTAASVSVISDLGTALLLAGQSRNQQKGSGMQSRRIKRSWIRVSRMWAVPI